MKNNLICLALLLAGFAASALAAESSGDQGKRQGQGQQRREPPARAFEACKEKSEGDTVQITLPSGESISAKCASSPKGLFARPEHPPRMQGNRESDDDKDQHDPAKEGY